MMGEKCLLCKEEFPIGFQHECRIKMKEPWIAKTMDINGERFEVHLGGSAHVLSLVQGATLARNILGLLGNE